MTIHAQVDKVVQQAMKEDANAFAYDEIYNDLQTNRQKQEESQAADRQKREVCLCMKEPFGWL